MSLSQNGYQVLPQLVDPAQVALCRMAILREEASGALSPDATVPGAPAGYNNTLLLRLHEHLRPRLEEATGKSLLRTYVYFRVYRKGSVLHKHKDRPACEYSITVNFGGASDVDWPIFVESRGQDVPVSLTPGDAMLYLGCEVPHWREPYTGEEQVQAFMHYVDRDGPNAAHEGDAIEQARRKG